MKKTILTLAALAALTSLGHAGNAPQGENAQTTFDPISFYNPHELQIDIFGTYAFSEDDGTSLFDEDTAGGGFGITYFITENIGFGGEGMIFDTNGDTLGSTSGNIIFRAPIGDSRLALYGFGGAGILFNADGLERNDYDDFDDARDADDIVFQAYVGVGAEFRLSPNFGIFTDVRRTFVDLDEADFTSARAGIRIAF